MKDSIESTPFADEERLSKEEFLDKLRSDPVFFAENILTDFKKPKEPMQLFWYQKLILRSKVKRILLNIARQSGKSSIAIVSAIHTAVVNSNFQVLILSRSQNQASELLRKLVRVVECSKISNDMLSCSSTKVAFKNGSIIVALPTSEATIKGYSPDLVILDEAAMFVDDSIFYEAVRPMLAATHGRLIIMSTPKGKRGFFWDMYKRWQEDPNAEVHDLPYRLSLNTVEKYGLDPMMLNALLCPLHDEEFYKTEALQMPTIKFSQEYCAMFVDESDAYFPYAIFKNQMRDGLELEFGDYDKEYYVGVDWGQVSDFSIVVVIEREEIGRLDYYKVVLLKRFPTGTPYKVPVDFTYDVSKRFNIAGGLADMGAGRKQIEDLQEMNVPIEGLAMSTVAKEELFALMRRMLEQKQLLLPHDEELEKQLHSFGYKIGKSGRLLLHHTMGEHDDMVDAIALALYAAQSKRTGADTSFTIPNF